MPIGSNELLLSFNIYFILFHSTECENRVIDVLDNILFLLDAISKIFIVINHTDMK